MMSNSHNQVFEKFKDEIITHCEDTKSGSWQKLSQQLEEVAGKEGFNFDLISPKVCVMDSVQKGMAKKFGGLAVHIDHIENAFYCLSLFALNLCRQPKNLDYHLIKTYTSFYTCNIASVMSGDDMPILLSMGYKITGKENEDELTLHHVSQDIESLAYQLFLAQLYCRRIKTMVITITTNGYSDEIATELFEHFDKPEFDMNMILEFCELKKVQNQRPKMQNTSPLSNMNNVNMNDENVYNTQSSSNMDNYNHHFPNNTVYESSTQPINHTGEIMSTGNVYNTQSSSKMDNYNYDIPHNAVYGSSTQPINRPGEINQSSDKTYPRQTYNMNMNPTINRSFQNQPYLASATHFEPSYVMSDGGMYENSRPFNSQPKSLLTELDDDDEDIYGVGIDSTGHNNPNHQYEYIASAADLRMPSTYVPRTNCAVVNTATDNYNITIPPSMTTSERLSLGSSGKPSERSFSQPSSGRSPLSSLRSTKPSERSSSQPSGIPALYQQYSED